MRDIPNEFKGFHEAIDKNELKIFISIPRLAILLFLRDRERRRFVEIRTHLCNEFSISDRVVLHHLELLVENRFVDKEMSGIYRITEFGRNVLDSFEFIKKDRGDFI